MSQAAFSNFRLKKKASFASSTPFVFLGCGDSQYLGIYPPPPPPKKLRMYIFWKKSIFVGRWFFFWNEWTWSRKFWCSSTNSFLHFLVENFPGEQHLRSLVLATGGENGAWEWGVSIWWMTEGKVRWKKVGDLRVSAFFLFLKKRTNIIMFGSLSSYHLFFLGCGCDWIGGTNWWCWWSEIWPIVLLRTKSSLQQTQSPRVQRHHPGDAGSLGWRNP